MLIPLPLESLETTFFLRKEKSQRLDDSFSVEDANLLKYCSIDGAELRLGKSPYYCVN